MNSFFTNDLIHNRHGRGGRGILRTDAPPHQHPRSYRIEVLRIRLQVGRLNAQIRLSLHLDTPPVVVILHRRIGANAHFFHARQRMEPLFDRPIEVSDLPL